MADSQSQNPLDLSQYITAQSEQANKSLGRSDTQYDWAKKQFDQNSATAKTVQDRALDTGASFADYAKKDRGLYDRTYVPAMEEQMAYARGYTTPERMAANRAQAIASGSLAANAVRAASERNLQSIGVDPSSGRYAGLEAGLDAKQAAMNAGMATKSDRDTEMMGQQLLANAIKTGQVLPGQAVNEAGVSLAADKEAIDTGLATTASGAQTMGSPLQWQTLGSDTLKEWKNSMVDQTKIGMQNNQQNFENQMKQAEADAKSSSGIGALIGAGAGILGTVVGGPLGGMVGSAVGKMAGSAIDSGGGSGFTFKRGGKVRGKVPAWRMRAGGVVREVPEPEDIEEEDEARRDLEHRGYKPKQRDEPARAWREPAEADDWYETPESDTGEEDSIQDRAMGNRTRSWVPNYAEGGAVDDDEGEGEGGGEGGLTEEEMEELEELREMERSGQLSDGSFHEYAGGGAVPEDNTDTLPPFDAEGRDYDYRTARLAGIQRGRDGHMASRDPATGMQLKGRGHPTFDQAVEEDRKLGYGLEKRDGRYYTQPFANGGTVGGMLRDTWGVNAYADGGEVEEPPMVDAEELAAAGGGGGDVPNLVPPEASPSGGEETDDVHAMLNEGEFVIPKQVVNWHGEKFFQKLIEKAYNEMEQPQVAEPEAGPPQAMALSPPTFQSQGA